MTDRKFTMRELMQCAQRETNMRRRVYPKWVRDGRMDERKADEEIAMMEQIALALGALAQKEST